MASHILSVVRLDGPAWVETAHFTGSDKWALRWSGERVEADMPAAFLKRFKNNDIIVVPNTRLHLRMRIDNGNREHRSRPPEYVVEEVLDIDVPVEALRHIHMVDDGK